MPPKYIKILSSPGEYHCRDGFVPSATLESAPFTGVLLSEPALTVSAIILDHKIECLGFRLEERFHVNIIKEMLSEMNLSIGPLASGVQTGTLQWQRPGIRLYRKRYGRGKHGPAFPPGEPGGTNQPDFTGSENSIPDGSCRQPGKPVKSGPVREGCRLSVRGSGFSGHGAGYRAR